MERVCIKYVKYLIGYCENKIFFLPLQHKAKTIINLTNKHLRVLVKDIL